MSNSVDFWYFLISLRATVPGLNLWGFFKPPVPLAPPVAPIDGAVFLAYLVAKCFVGFLFADVLFLAVSFVLAISSILSCIFFKFMQSFLSDIKYTSYFNLIGFVRIFKCTHNNCWIISLLKRNSTPMQFHQNYV